MKMLLCRLGYNFKVLKTASRKVCYKDLKHFWKNREDRKPLILNGARQVGKIWLLREFARTEYKKMAYVVCRKNDDSRLEFDFVIQCEARLLPIEVKVYGNVRANSLSQMLMENPELKAVRYSMLPYKEQGQMTNAPLYAV